MPRPDLQLLPGSLGGASIDEVGSFRLRPSERAAWIDVEAAARDMQAWMREAAAIGLSVDVLVAIKLEWALVRSDVPDQHVAALVEAARQDGHLARLAPSDELRRWVGYLARGPQLRAEHDLPSIALPARVVARIAPGALVASVVAAANEDLGPAALVVERTASLNGMTMESWAFRALARLQ